MKKKIKTWFIHLLGGVTESEKRKSNKKKFRLGMNGACIDIRDYADSLYGKPADEWCKLMYEFICGMQERLTHGTDEERAVFIANAEKYYNGKYNPDTLQVEPVKPKCPFTPFGKVLVRDDGTQEWCANYFSHYRENDEDYPYACIDSSYRYCIPYNEHTAHLLGTTDPYTEGGIE